MNCGKNVRLKPKKTINAAKRAHAFGIHPPGHLRPPEMHAAEIRHHHAADHDVMKMGDHEIGIVHVHVDASDARKSRSGRRW